MFWLNSNSLVLALLTVVENQEFSFSFYLWDALSCQITLIMLPLVSRPREVSVFKIQEFSLTLPLSSGPTVDETRLAFDCLSTEEEVLGPSGIEAKTLCRLSARVSLNFSYSFRRAESFMSSLVQSSFCFLSYSRSSSSVFSRLAMVALRRVCSSLALAISACRISTIFWFLVFSLIYLLISFLSCAISVQLSLIFLSSASLAVCCSASYLILDLVLFQLFCSFSYRTLMSFLDFSICSRYLMASSSIFCIFSLRAFQLALKLVMVWLEEAFWFYRSSLKAYRLAIFYLAQPSSLVAFYSLNCHSFLALLLSSYSLLMVSVCSATLLFSSSRFLLSFSISCLSLSNQILVEQSPCLSLFLLSLSQLARASSFSSLSLDSVLDCLSWFLISANSLLSTSVCLFDFSCWFRSNSLWL